MVFKRTKKAQRLQRKHAAVAAVTSEATSRGADILTAPVATNKLSNRTVKRSALAIASSIQQYCGTVFTTRAPAVTTRLDLQILTSISEQLVRAANCVGIYSHTDISLSSSSCTNSEESQRIGQEDRQSVLLEQEQEERLEAEHRERRRGELYTHDESDIIWDLTSEEEETELSQD